MDVKIGMNMLLWGTQITPAHSPVFESLAKAGYDGVEIPVGQQSEAELRAIASVCSDLGLECTASAFVGAECNPISIDARSRAAAVESLNDSIDRASALGADILIGGIYQAHKYFTGRGATQQELDWCTEYLQACGEHAQRAGISLGLEVLNRFEVFLINTVADCKCLVEQVGLSNVGVHYDTHHANIEESAPDLALAHCADVLNHVHLSESHRGTLGTGQVDWQGTFDALRRIDYSGWLVVEAFGTEDPALAEAANVWRNAFDSPAQLCCDAVEFIRARL